MKAFPHADYMKTNDDVVTRIKYLEQGMDLRDYFAAKIIGGYVAGMKPNPVAQEGVCANGFALNNAEALAKASYILADALMIAREL